MKKFSKHLNPTRTVSD